MNEEAKVTLNSVMVQVINEKPKPEEVEEIEISEEV